MAEVGAVGGVGLVIVWAQEVGCPGALSADVAFLKRRIDVRAYLELRPCCGIQADQLCDIGRNRTR